jgi:non-specific serine/threonine protein kinase
LTSFIGRRAELTETRALLANGRLVTLMGTGGVGKTRLAVRTADQLRRAFPDGVHLVELASVDNPDLVARTVAVTLGLRDVAADPGADLCSFLKTKGLLLVLDNCEHLAEACARLVTMLLAAAPGVRVLTTSRHVLGLAGEQVLRIGPLAVPDVAGLDGALALDVVGLFAERAETAAPGFRVDAANWPKVVQLCRRLDGNPLAIELAAAWMRVLTLDDVLDRVDDRFRLLTRGSRIAHRRQRTLLSAVEWSSGLCSPPERLLWARLSVFAGGFDLDAVEEVCSGDGIDRADVLLLLAALVDKSILQAETGDTMRYRMQETIREFGRGWLREAGGENALRIRHRDHFLAFAQRGEQDWLRGRPQLAVARRTRADHANLRAALEFCLGTPGHEAVGLRLAVTLHYFWLCCGFLAEGRLWLHRALAHNPLPGRDRAKALWLTAWAPNDLDDARAGFRHALESEEWSREHGDESTLAHAQLVLGVCLFYLGELDRSAELFAEAAARFDILGETNTVVLGTSAMMALTAAFQDSAEFGVAVAVDGLSRCDAVEEQWARTFLLFALASAQWRLGQLDDGLKNLAHGLRIAQAFNDTLGAALTLEGTAWITATAGDSVRAAELLGVVHQTWPLVGGEPLLGSLPLTEAHEQTEWWARKSLGPKAFEAAFQRGAAAATSLDEAVTFALGTAPTVVPAEVATTADPNRVLTKREQEVAGLVAEGLSNREIADRLVISQRTAETHVNRVLGKLGFTSRTQLAARMAEDRHDV